MDLQFRERQRFGFGERRCGMSIVNRISDWFRQLAALPTEEEVYADMEQEEPRQKTPPLESFKASLRASLSEAIHGLTLRQIDGGEFVCSAPLRELDDEKTPLLLDLIIDLEFHPPQWTRIWFELEFKYLNRVEMTGIYRATCDMIQ